MSGSTGLHEAPNYVSSQTTYWSANVGGPSELAPAEGELSSGILSKLQTGGIL